ncbi:hypothetical protein NEUTE1DRAFT_80603 [Neurospora tetrasperma FGSC 2508]|uniref:Rhodopsin domain-containing protein n=1 Tax=Neurospora tetrasperma (strain FGSC 2508 / ATCC MYA-4615 / P0657) TaxID=510951 RepID=F8MFE5_NEUT8|nr:uncharacterized protein NEUTE1DRAFT_80603 [Neurospora tetrasperma FGSC 2508]EGO59999.1 hypothetical protein NEUTE1DRAFT_80603 [Neurospora tetrasperma FGSC 2508]EGZ74150.1 hypothetical protein NEUTE2DRAFT_109498 [Neurospora tetrasperma FGSC 2509]
MYLVPRTSDEHVQAEAARFVREAWGLQGAAYIVVILRYFSRIRQLGWRKLALDDFLMFAALITYTAETTVAHVLVTTFHGLANNGITDIDRALLSPQSEEYQLRILGSKAHVAGLLLYTTLLWLLKACWSVYYARLTVGVHNMRMWVVGAYVIMPATYMACLCVAIFKCVPFEKQWQIYPNPGNNCTPAVSELQTVFVMVMNTVTDFYLLAIPLPMVWKSNLTWRKKFFLLLMFSGGFIEMAFGILRCVCILTLGDTDAAQSGYWSVRESFVSFVLTNMPMVYPLVKRFMEKSIISLSGGTSGIRKDGVSGHNGYALDSTPSSQKGGPRNRVVISKTSKHPLSDDTLWGSEENIVSSDDGKMVRGSWSSTASSRDIAATDVIAQGSGGGRGRTMSVERGADLIEPQNSGGSGRNWKQKGIIVTHEVTVTEDRRDASAGRRC